VLNINETDNKCLVPSVMFGAIRYVECIYILLVKVCVGRNDRAFDEIT